jgi:iron complex transport system substrate-binding protein
MRICSFLPAATEILFSLNLGEQIAGVTHECDYPPEARHKPVVVRSAIDAKRSTSSDIDSAVREAVASGKGLYAIDAAALATAAPDIIVTQALSPRSAARGRCGTSRPNHSSGTVFLASACRCS